MTMSTSGAIELSPGQQIIVGDGSFFFLVLVAYLFLVACRFDCNDTRISQQRSGVSGRTHNPSWVIKPTASRGVWNVRMARCFGESVCFLYQDEQIQRP